MYFILVYLISIVICSHMSIAHIAFAHPLTQIIKVHLVIVESVIKIAVSENVVNSVIGRKLSKEVRCVCNSWIAIVETAVAHCADGLPGSSRRAGTGMAASPRVLPPTPTLPHPRTRIHNHLMMDLSTHCPHEQSPVSICCRG